MQARDQADEGEFHEAGEGAQREEYCPREREQGAQYDEQRIGGKWYPEAESSRGGQKIVNDQTRQAQGWRLKNNCAY